jgi:hypothetical protein
MGKKLLCLLYSFLKGLLEILIVMEVKSNHCRISLISGRRSFEKLKQPRSYIQCCGSGMLIPDPNFFHPRSRVKIAPNTVSELAKKVFLTQRVFTKLSEYGMIPVVHRGYIFFSISSGSRIQGSKKHWIPDPDPQY